MSDTATEAKSHESPLTSVLEEAGAVFAPYHGTRVARHFGDPHGEYVAATEGLAVFDRGHRTRLVVTGRAPTKMLTGVLTGVMPPPPSEVEPGVIAGRGTYHAVLTPKGKMISDLVAVLRGSAEDGSYLLDVPVSGRAGLMEHFGRFLPPRFAAVRDASEEMAAISVVGPRAAEALAKLALGLSVDAEALTSAEEGRWWTRGSGEDGLLVVRTAEVWPQAWTVYGPGDAVAALWRALLREGAVAAGLGVWKTLTVEAGRPTFGADMDEGTLPPEAGIVDRAVDHTKGCYTGQEVIVRIRDRGHVNRHLRRLVLGEGPAPQPGTELVAADGSGKVVGTVTSAVQSPAFGGVAALAYVRRGVDRVLVGGAEVRVPDHFPSPEDLPRG